MIPSLLAFRQRFDLLALPLNLRSLTLLLEPRIAFFGWVTPIRVDILAGIGRIELLAG